MEIRDKIASLNAINSTQQIKIANIRENKNTSLQLGNKEEQLPQEVARGNAREISKEEIIEGVDILNDTMKLYNHKLHFEIHEDTQRMKVAVVDKRTDEVIKEIPPEEMLDMLAKIQDMIGFFLDKRI